VWICKNHVWSGSSAEQWGDWFKRKSKPSIAVISEETKNTDDANDKG